MKTLLLIAGLIFLTACTRIGVGVSVHNGETKYFENPLGVVRFEQRFNDNIDSFCEHISSIPMVDDIIVINHCGFMYNF